MDKTPQENSIRLVTDGREVARIPMGIQVDRAFFVRRGYRCGRTYPSLGVRVSTRTDAGVEHERAPTTDRTRIPSAKIEYRAATLRTGPVPKIISWSSRRAVKPPM